MDLVELQKMADKGYANGESMVDNEYFKPDTGEPTDWHSGDSLNWFMHIEIAETFDKDSPDDMQIREAITALESGQNDLQGAIESLREGLMLCKSKNSRKRS